MIFYLVNVVGFVPQPFQLFCNSICSLLNPKLVKETVLLACPVHTIFSVSLSFVLEIYKIDLDEINFKLLMPLKYKL